MSEQNLEMVRRNLEAFNRCDLTTWLASFSPDAEIDWSRARALFKGVYRGRAKQEEFWNEFWSTFENVQVEYHGFTEVGNAGFVPNTAYMRGRQGIEVVARSTFLITVDGRRITHFRLFQEEAEALKAAGLWE